MSALPLQEHGVEQTGIAGWLRVVPDPSVPVLRVAMLLISMDSETKEFSFTQLDASPQVNTFQQGRHEGLSEAIVSLVRLSKLNISLLFALAEEVSSGVLGQCLGSHPMSCRISRPVSEEGSHSSSMPNAADALWETENPDRNSEVFKLLETVCNRSHLMEGFHLVAEGLEAAFLDPVIKGFYAMGLTSVTRLSELDAAADSPSSLLEWFHSRIVLPAPDPAFQALDWAGALMPFQQEGVEALLQNERLLLADDMGLGKTIQAIAALRILRARGDLASCLVVAPASVLRQWRAELDKWAPEMSAIVVQGSRDEREWQWPMRRDVKMVSYDTLRSEHGYRSPIFLEAWDVVIADEAQRAKNRNATSAALKGLRRTRSWALTGTPIENDEDELASIMEFIDHDGRGCGPRFSPGEALRTRHRRFQVRRRKSEVLDDLPPKQIALVPMELPPDQRSSYDQAEHQGIVYLKSLGTEVGVEHVLELITRLKQICNVDARTGQSCKLADIKERLAQLSAQGHKALVFSQYTSEIHGVRAAVDYLREFNPLALTGDVPLEERGALIDQFRNSDRHHALIISLRVGGLGLNLQEASYVFHFDRWWNPALERQAEDRTHRMGQTVKVNVIKYSCVDTIEERIDQILQRKQKLFNELVDDVSLNLSARLTKEELFGLFGLS